MKKLNHYQKDIGFILGLMALQLVFSAFYPFNNPNVEPIKVSRQFIFIRFEFLTSQESVLYIPFLMIIFGFLLIALLLQKKKRFALIYGYALVLVAKAYYLTELYALEGRYEELHVTGFLSKRVVDNSEVLAQDLSLYILIGLLVIKIGIYVHDMLLHKEIIKPQSY